MRVGTYENLSIVHEHKILPDIWSFLLTSDLCGETTQWIAEAEWHTDMNRLTSLNHSNNIDMLYDIFLMSQYRSDIIHFSYPITSTPIVFDIPTSLTLVNDTDPINWLLPRRILAVFGPDLWPAIIVSLAIMGIVNGICSAIFHRQFLRPWAWFGHFCLQCTSSEARNLSTAARCLLIVTSLLTFHSLVLYQGCLLGDLVKPMPFHVGY